MDDAETLLPIYRLTLEFAGIYHCITLHDSREVLSLLAKQKAELLVLDLSMAHVSEEQILEKIGQEYPDLPVIVMTGINDVDTTLRCIPLGAADYLVKPVVKDGPKVRRVAVE